MLSVIKHSTSGKTIIGRRLSPGENIIHGDKYNSSDGNWREDSQLVGRKVPEGDHIIWVRPQKIPN
jgi:hypothetical protein